MNDHASPALRLRRQVSEAVAAMRVNSYDEAVAITQEIIAAKPDHPGAHAVQFSSLFKAKRFEEARQMGSAAARLNPESIFILNNQACLQLEAKQPASAAVLLKSLVNQFGERSQWLYNLALAQRMVGNYDYSVATFRRTLEHQPDHDRAAFQLAECLNVMGQKEEALRAFDYVRLLRNKHAASHSNYIHHAVANGSIDKHGLKQELRLWEQRFIPSDSRYPEIAILDPDRTRIGFLVGVVPSHWLEASIAPLINQLANSNDHLFVYWHDEKLRNDVFSDQVAVIHSPGFSDADFARRVRADRVDVLIDVCGMRRGSRQRPLGLQLAHKEYGWLAHEGVYATPRVALLEEKLGAQRFFVSKKRAIKPTPMPQKTLSGIGCRYGLSHHVIKVWAEILAKLPDWNLHLDSASILVNKPLTKHFHSLGIEQNRLLFDPNLTIGQGTIVLDNFIENDPIAAGNAVGNGGVLVALRGELFPAQQNSALLEQIDRPKWIATNQADYMNRVIALTNGARLDPLDKLSFNNSGIRDLVGYAKRFRRALLT